MRLRRLLVLVAAATASTMLIMPGLAAAAEEHGSTNKWPWSGYWWPMQENGYNLYSNNGPLQKYDQYLTANGMRAGAQAWERRYHYTDNPAATWWGHCHAWAAAAILAPEPQAVTRSGVSFNVNDAKGITSALYYEPTFTWLSGNRVNDPNDRSSAAYQDIAPVWMDYLLRYYVRYHKYPFIMDVNADAQVWNYPVFAYKRSSTEYAGGIEDVRTTVWFSSPDWNQTGTRYFSKTYTYRLQSGTLGSWTGSSVHDHPDYAWVPTGKRPGTDSNPFVTERVVEAITGLDV